MTELSYFHNGSMRGDGRYSPYDAASFHSVWHTIINSGVRNGVISDTTNPLAVVATGADMEVDIAAGSAFIEGVYFDSDGTESIELDTGGPRIDRIVIRVNWATQTARLAVVKGELGSPWPEEPDLQQNPGEIYEFPLARVYVGAAAITLDYYNVVDERKFVQTAQSHPIVNIMHNSEFIYGAHSGTVAPAYWEVTGSPTLANVVVPKNEYVGRGNVIDADMAGGEKIETTIYVDNTSSTLYNQDKITIAFYLHVLSGGTNINVNGVLLTVANPTANPELFLYRLGVGGAASNYINLEFEEGHCQIYPITAAFGLNAAPFEPHKEIVLHHDPDYGGTINHAGGGSVPISTLFGTDNALNPSTRQETALIIEHTVYDAGSAGADVVYADIGNNNARVEVGRLPNSTRRYVMGILPGLTDTADLYLLNATTSGGFIVVVFDLIGVIT